MLFRTSGLLPTDVLAKTDPRYESAAYGDAMIRLNRWTRRAAPVVGISIAAGAALIASMTSPWLYALALVGFGTYLTLTVAKPRVPWNHDYRAPLLVLRSFTDLRTKLGDELPTVEFALGGGGRLSFIWHMGEALWDRCRIIFLEEEETEADLKVFGIVLKTADNWEQQALHIAVAAWAILIFPAATPSCLREMQLLRDHDLLHKVIVAMPPTANRLAQVVRVVTGNGLLATANHAEAWSSLRTEMLRHGYSLPPYDPSGMFYVPQRDYSARSVVKLANDWEWLRLFDAVAGPGILDEPLWDLLSSMDAFENDRREWGIGGLAMKMALEHVDRQMGP